MKITKFHQCLVLLASFFAQFVSEGIMWSFTIYYPVLSRYFQATNAEISLVGSFAYGSWCCVGPLAGYLVEKVGSTPVMLWSSLFGTVFIFAGAFASRLWHIILCFSFFSLCCGCAFIPSVTVITDFFPNFRNFATTIVTVGGAAGAVCYPLLFQYWLNTETWQFCFIITAGFTLQLTVFSFILERKPSQIKTNRKLSITNVHCSAITVKKAADEATNNASKENGARISLLEDNQCKSNTGIGNTLVKRTWTKANINLALYAIHCFLWNLTGFGFYTVLPLFLDAQKYTVTDIAYVLSICALAVIIGRCLAALCCIRKNFDKILFFNFSTLLTVVWTMLFVLEMNFFLYCTFSALYGLFLGIQTALMPVITLEIMNDKHINLSFGIIVCACGTSGLVCPYVCGWLIDALQRYDYIFALISFPSFICCFLMLHLHWPLKNWCNK